MNALSGKCPEQYVEVAAFLRKKMDMFCDGNDVTQRFQSGMKNDLYVGNLLDCK
jgi:hypothetical protein